MPFILGKILFIWRKFLFFITLFTLGMAKNLAMCQKWVVRDFPENTAMIPGKHSNDSGKLSYVFEKLSNVFGETMLCFLRK